jgi:hypothetical protein
LGRWLLWDLWKWLLENPWALWKQLPWDLWNLSLQEARRPRVLSFQEDLWAQCFPSSKLPWDLSRRKELLRALWHLWGLSHH